MKTTVGEVCNKLTKVNNILSHIEIYHSIAEYYMEDVVEILTAYRDTLCDAEVNI